jgi:hypothetical protein
LDSTTFEPMSPEELEQMEEEHRQEHQRRHPNEGIQFVGNPDN